MQLYAIPGRSTPDELDAAAEQFTVVSMPARETFEAAVTVIVGPDPEPAAAA